MKTIKQISQIEDDGILLLQMPAEFKDTAVEVVVVVHPLPSEEVKPKYISIRIVNTTIDC